MDATIVGAAAAVRLWGLGADGLWFDEASTAVVAQLPLDELLAAVAADNQAPLWFLVVKASTALLGDSELAVRLPSALAGILAVWAVLVAGRRFLSAGVGRAAAILLATSPMAVHYAREARGYALLMLLAVVGWYAAVRLAHEPRRRHAAVLVAASVSIVYTHNLGVLVVVGVWSGGLLAAPPDRARRQTWLRVMALTLVLCAPWFAVLRAQVGELEHSFSWARQVFRSEAPWQLARSVAAMSPGAPPPVRNRVANLSASAAIGGAAVALLVLAGCAARRRLHTPSAPVALMAAWALPLSTVWLASWVLPTPVYVVGRVDAPVLPLLLLGVSAGLVALSRPLRPPVVAALVALALPSLVTIHRVDTRSQDRSLSRRVAALRTHREPVVTTTLEAVLHHYTEAGDEGVLLRFPSTTRRFMNWSEVGGGDSAELARDARRVAAHAVGLARSGGVRRVWLVRTPNRVGDAIEAALRDRGTPVALVATDYLGLRIVGFAVEPPTSRPGRARDPLHTAEN